MMRKYLAMALLSAVDAFVGMDKAVMAMHQPTSAFAEPSRRQINKYRAQGSAWSYPAHDGHSPQRNAQGAKPSFDDLGDDIPFAPHAPRGSLSHVL